MTCCESDSETLGTARQVLVERKPEAAWQADQCHQQDSETGDYDSSVLVKCAHGLRMGSDAEIGRPRPRYNEDVDRTEQVACLDCKVADCQVEGHGH